MPKKILGHKKLIFNTKIYIQMNNLYQLKKTQILQASLLEVWNFIQDPSNLSKITPADMGFEIKGEKPTKMYPGMIISYRVRPLLGIPMNWVTEITHMVEQSYFVDEQRLGPYRVWHHEHHLKPHENGVEMIDIVSYSIGWGILDPLIQKFIIAPQLEKIFNYREKILIHKFGV